MTPETAELAKAAHERLNAKNLYAHYILEAQQPDKTFTYVIEVIRVRGATPLRTEPCATPMIAYRKMRKLLDPVSLDLTDVDSDEAVDVIVAPAAAPAG